MMKSTSSAMARSAVAATTLALVMSSTPPAHAVGRTDAQKAADQELRQARLAHIRAKPKLSLDYDNARKMTTAGFVLMGSGELVAIVGGTIGVIFLLGEDDEGTGEGGEETTQSSGPDPTFVTTMTMIGVGGAALLTGAILLLVAKKRRKRIYAATPWGSPRGGGVSLRLRY